MHVTIEIPEDRAAVSREQAFARGITVEQWLLEIVEQNALANSTAHLQTTNPEEWGKRFRAWAKGHEPREHLPRLDLIECSSIPAFSSARSRYAIHNSTSWPVPFRFR